MILDTIQDCFEHLFYSSLTCFNCINIKDCKKLNDINYPKEKKNKDYLKKPNDYIVDFVVKLKECEPFTIIYSEIDKFCKEMIKRDLISGYEIKYE